MTGKHTEPRSDEEWAEHVNNTRRGFILVGVNLLIWAGFVYVIVAGPFS